MENLGFLVLIGLVSWGWLEWVRGKETMHRRFRSLSWIYAFFGAGVLSVIPVWLFSIPREILVSIDLYSGTAGTLFLSHFFLVALPEESAKFLAFWILTKYWRPLTEPFDAIARALLVGLGFGMVENYFYAGEYGLATLVLRLFNSTTHPLYAIMTAFSWGLLSLYPDLKANRELRLLPWAGFVFSLVLHAGWNASGANRMLDALRPVFVIAGYVLIGLWVKKASLLSPWRPFKAKETRQAIEILRRAMLVDPGNPTLHFRLGLRFLVAADWSAACVAFDGASALGKLPAFAECWYAVAVFAGGSPERARAILDENWPHLTSRQQQSFHRILATTLPTRRVLRNCIRDLTDSLSWMPRSEAELAVAGFYGPHY